VSISDLPLNQERAVTQNTTFVSNVYDHLRHVNKWATLRPDAVAVMDIKDYTLHVKQGASRHTLFPRFMHADSKGRRWYSAMLDESANGFIGWLPYGPQKFDLSDSKLQFKQFISDKGFSVPDVTLQTTSVPFDYIVKSEGGSFGEQLIGPYRAFQTPDSIYNVSNADPAYQSRNYAERFVEGSILKVWCWGERPFFAHHHRYPTVTGDGLRTIEQLLQEKLMLAGSDIRISNSAGVIKSCVAFQGHQLHDVLPIDRTLWMDYRYGYSHTMLFISKRSIEQHQIYHQHFGLDNALLTLDARQKLIVESAVKCCAEYLARRFARPILFALDASIDKEGNIWWLEINSNPSLPACGYQLIFEELFNVGQ
jgi:hypothetical protein